MQSDQPELTSCQKYTEAGRIANHQVEVKLLLQAALKELGR